MASQNFKDTANGGKSSSGAATTNGSSSSKSKSGSSGSGTSSSASHASGHSGRLSGKRVAVLATHGVELLEITEPTQGLREAGADVKIIALDNAPIVSWNMTAWDNEIEPDLALSEAVHQDWDALFLPGGPLNADVMRPTDLPVFFTNEYFFKRDKPVGALCHAQWVLVECDVLRGRRVTSYPAIASDLRNAGATWVNRSVVVEGNLVTGRSPADTPEFVPALIEHIATYKSDETHTAAGMQRYFTPKSLDPKTGPSAQPGA